MPFPQTKIAKKYTFDSTVVAGNMEALETALRNILIYAIEAIPASGGTLLLPQLRCKKDVHHGLKMMQKAWKINI